MSKTNDQKIKDYKKKKIIKCTLVFVGLLVIALEILAIFNVISMIWGLIVFIIMYLFEKIILK